MRKNIFIYIYNRSKRTRGVLK